MAFGQCILEMEVFVTEALRNTVDLWSLHRVRLAKPQLKFSNLNCTVQTKCINNTEQYGVVKNY